MSKIADTEANATSLDSLVNDNALVPTLRNGPKPSYQYLVDGWNTEIDALTGNFAQESTEAITEFNLTLDQYKESRGFDTKGTFAAGFTYELPNDVGLDADGNPWAVIDTETLPVVVTAGTTPTNPPFKQVSYGTAAQVSTNTSDTVQSFVDSFALKIFQSPTDGGLTEIQTRTVDAGGVYEVRKTSDDSIANIYSDAAGANEIVQNGITNVSGSDGVVEFYIADGNYYVEVNSAISNFIAGPTILQVNTISGLQELKGTGRQQVSVAMYHNISDLSGGGTFVWSTGSHNGGTFIDPNRQFPTDWDDQNQLESWFADSGADVEGWRRQCSDAVNIKWFGAKGDSVTNDTFATFNAADEASIKKISGYIPAGEYVLDTDTPLFFKYGLNGDGSEITKIQGVNNGTVKPSLLYIGTGENGGFTVDGACSDDPAAWNSTNYDSFTGHSRTVMIKENNSVIRDMVSQNSVRAPIHCELRTNVVFENCHTIRGRGNYGDGWYIQRGASLSLVNCTAYDYTRIGFVCEGKSGRVTDGVTFTNCKAEYGHDQGINYGGTEFNSGFWSENATNIYHINCRSKDNTDRGFTYAGTVAVTDLDKSSANIASYVNCVAQGSLIGFNAGALGEAETRVSYTNCSGIFNRSSFTCNGASVNYNLCNAKLIAGSDGVQDRVFSVGDNADVTIDGFIEEWDGKGSNYYDSSQDTGSISKFSTHGPRSIKISNYKTTNSSKAILKLRANSANGELCAIDIENSDIALGTIRSSSKISVSNSDLIIQGTITSDKLSVIGSNVLLDTKEAMRQLKTVFSRCNIGRSSDNYLYLFNERNEKGPRISFDDCEFVCNLNEGYMLRFNSESSVSGLVTSLFSVFKTCRFVHTGDPAPSLSYVRHDRSSTVSRIYLYDCFKDGDFTFTQLSDDSRIIDL